MDVKAWYASKTLWFNLLVLIVMVANFFGFSEFQVDEETSAAFAGIVAILNLVLRSITRVPISR